jgi:hypothetical protein
MDGTCTVHICSSSFAVSIQTPQSLIYTPPPSLLLVVLSGLLMAVLILQMFFPTVERSKPLCTFRGTSCFYDSEKCMTLESQIKFFGQWDSNHKTGNVLEKVGHMGYQIILHKTKISSDSVICT